MVIMCAHVQVVVFKRVAADDENDKVAWVYAGLKRPHTHDVRALAVAPAPDDPSTSLLFSAGNDSQVRSMPITRTGGPLTQQCRLDMNSRAVIPKSPRAGRLSHALSLP